MRAAACVVVLSLTLAGCGAGGSSAGGGPTAPFVDVKAACAALADLHRAADALNGVDVGDPGVAEAALIRAITAYRGALARFEQAGPPSLRATAETVRAAVGARQFARAATARAAIDAWAASHCD